LLLVLGGNGTTQGKGESNGRSEYGLYHSGSRRVR
jgi:hypothetical protein